MQHELVRFLDTLNEAKSYEAAWAATHEFFRDQGFEQLMCAYGQVTEGVVAIAEIKEDWIPGEWRADLHRHAHDPDNMVNRHLVSHLTPLLVGPDFVDRKRHGEAFWRFQHETSAPWGIRSAFMLPLRYKIDRAIGAFGGMSSMKGSEFSRYFAERGMLLQLASLYADQTLCALKVREEAEAVRLSPRERECLLWLSRGLRNDRIAERIGISNATVELHLANARRKLQAATREQALTRAIFLGLVTP